MKQEIINLLPGDHPWQNQIIWFDSIDSTNTAAKTMALQGAPHGTVLVADHQTGGRGRMGRSFQSPKGCGIYMSVILRPDCTADKLMHLTCAAATAMCDAVEVSAGFRPGIKWTNDLVHGQRKLAGILTELIHTKDGVCAIVGIGINCRQNQGDFDPGIRDMAGSLHMVTGAPVDRARVAAAMIRCLTEMDASLLTDTQPMLERYRRDCVTLGRQVSIHRGTEVRHALALDVDGQGALLVRYADGTEEAVSSGEVSVRGMYGYV